MSLTDSNSYPMVMPVSPMGGYGNSGFGGWGSDMWLFLIILFACGGFGGWGRHGRIRRYGIR